MTDEEKAKAIENIQKQLNGEINDKGEWNGYEKYLAWFNKMIKELTETHKCTSESLRISWPLFINLEWQGYIPGKETILIIGEETFGYPSVHWIKDVWEIWENWGSRNYPGDRQVEDILKINKICCNLFAFPCLPEKKDKKYICLNTETHTCKKPGKSIDKHYNKAFWSFFKEIRKRYPVNGYNLVWTNLVKFDQDDRALKSTFSKNLIKDQAEILKHEIMTLMPKKIIILSNPNNSKTLYNQIIEELKNEWISLTNKEKIIIWGTNEGTFLQQFSFQFNSSVKENNIEIEIPVIQMYHPGHAFNRFNGKLTTSKGIEISMPEIWKKNNENYEKNKETKKNSCNFIIDYVSKLPE